MEVLGELEEIKDRLAASEALRAAAERRADDGAARCSSLEAEAQHGQSLAQTVQAGPPPVPFPVASIYATQATRILSLHANKALSVM